MQLLWNIEENFCQNCMLLLCRTERVEVQLVCSTGLQELTEEKENALFWVNAGEAV